MEDDIKTESNNTGGEFKFSCKTSS